MDLSPHKQRIATSACLAVLPALALIFQGWVLYAVLSLICVLTLWEFYSMFRPTEGMMGFRPLGAAFAFLLTAAFASGDIRYPGIVLLLAFWTSGIMFLIRYSKDMATSFRHSAIFMAGLIYIPLNLQFFLNFNRFEIIMVIGAAALSDTAAFYTGTLWGKKKIWPKISPKKSWMGSMGGLTACTAGVTAYGITLGAAPWWQWILLGAALNVAAQVGDFFESALKRSLDVKDSGTILPGHGGLLDRLDSLLLAAPVYGLIAMFHPFFE